MKHVFYKVAIVFFLDVDSHVLFIGSHTMMSELNRHPILRDVRRFYRAQWRPEVSSRDRMDELERRILQNANRLEELDWLVREAEQRVFELQQWRDSEEPDYLDSLY